MSEKVPGEKPGLLIHYTVDGELQSTTLEALTPREVLGNAGIDPDTHVLNLVEGSQHRSFHDLDEPIPIREHMTFTTAEKSERTQADQSTAARASSSSSRTEVSSAVTSA